MKEYKLWEWDSMINYLYGKDVVDAYPDGWSCISCGAEFTEKTIDVECLYVIHNREGTECLKCVNQQAKGSHELTKVRQYGA